MLPSTALLAGLACVAVASPMPEGQAQSNTASPAGLTRQNDWNCKSARHPNPVVLLHGLFATEDLDLNFLEAWLRKKGFCTFAITYGSYAGFVPVLGGVKPVEESSHEVADFIRKVHDRTGAAKVDVVGHSEGGFQALWTAKYNGVAPIVDNIVAIAPPTHGTSLSGLYDLAYVWGHAGRDAVFDVLNAVGCGACADFAPDGPGVRKLADGPIAQPGNAVTVIASRADEVVTPPPAAFVREPGVTNIYVQDYCRLDPAGHIGVVLDPNVWNLVLNSLEKQIGRRFLCLAGPPGR